MNRFCTACGKNIEEDAGFCGACGKPIKAATGAGEAAGARASSASSALRAGTTGERAPATANSGPSISRPTRPAADLPPDTVFAGAAGGGMASGGGSAMNGGPIPPEPDPAYFEVGSESDGGGPNKYWIGGGALLLLLIAGLYYFIFVNDDMAAEGGRPTADTDQTKAAEAAPESKLFFASATANIRDMATVEGSEILGKLKRGDEARGIIIQSEDGAGEWLKLEEGQGFVFLANLNEEARPALATNLGRKSITLAAPAKLLSAPSADAELLDSLSKGLSLNIAGITEGDFAEVILRKGGVGYIANGAKLVKDGDGPRGAELAIKLNDQGCAAGDEVDKLYAKLDARSAAALQKIEDAQYPDDVERQAAIDAYYSKVEGKSEFQKLERIFKGLQISGIARHYEAQAIYFAEPVEKVRKAFRDLGYKVSSQGELASMDISAGIYTSRGTWAKYGNTALECGV